MAATTRLRQSSVPDLKSFDGRSRDEFKCKSWLSSVRAAFRRDGLQPGEACLLFPELLTSSAKLWYRQLGRTIRVDWTLLQKEFETEYCGAAMTAQARYYELRRRASEEPLDYLYRLNVQANEAKIPYNFGADARAHVKHFINTCEDAELAKMLSSLRLVTEPDLRDVLKDRLHQEYRAKREEASKLRGSKKEAPKGSAKKPITVDHVSRARIAKLSGGSSKVSGGTPDYSEDDGSSESDVMESAEGSDSEDELTGAKTSSRSTDVVEAVAQWPAEAIEALAKVFMAMKADGDTKAKPGGGERDGRKPRAPCTHCGSTKHQDRDCWRRLTCDSCGRSGHPSEHCYQRCKGCGEVHERGDCALEKIASQLKAWYNPTQHAGLLPQAIEKWLN